MMVACQWNWSFSSEGPAEQLAGGSLPISTNSYAVASLGESRAARVEQKTRKEYLLDTFESHCFWS